MNRATGVHLLLFLFSDKLLLTNNKLLLASVETTLLGHKPQPRRLLQAPAPPAPTLLPSPFLSSPRLVSLSLAVAHIREVRSYMRPIYHASVRVEAEGRGREGRGGEGKGWLPHSLPGPAEPWALGPGR